MINGYDVVFGGGNRMFDAAGVQDRLANLQALIGNNNAAIGGGMGPGGFAHNFMDPMFARPGGMDLGSAPFIPNMEGQIDGG